MVITRGSGGKEEDFESLGDDFVELEGSEYDPDEEHEGAVEPEAREAPEGKAQRTPGKTSLAAKRKRRLRGRVSRKSKKTSKSKTGKKGSKRARTAPVLPVVPGNGASSSSSSSTSRQPLRQRRLVFSGNLAASQSVVVLKCFEQDTRVYRGGPATYAQSLLGRFCVVQNDTVGTILDEYVLLERTSKTPLCGDFQGSLL
jgi:hypothetical protein